MFDGNVTFISVKEEQPHKRRPRNVAPQQKRITLCSVNKKGLIENMKQTVSTAVQMFDPMQMDRIVVEVDNAGGDGGGHGNMEKTVLKELNEWNEKASTNTLCHANPFHCTTTHITTLECALILECMELLAACDRCDI